MCCATQPPQVPNHRQMGSMRWGEGSSVSMSSARLPSISTSARSPGKAPGTIAPLLVSPCPCASSATIETSVSGSATARTDEKFARPGAAKNRRGREAEHRPSLRFDRGAHSFTRAIERRFARDPALDEIGAIELELRLDQADEPRPLTGKLKHMWQHESLRNEAHVDD